MRTMEFTPKKWAGNQLNDTFHKGMQKAGAFKSGATFYHDRKNYGHAAFMLHQSIELMYRAIEQLMMGVDKKSHSIQIHQKYISEHVPALGNLFLNPDGSASQLLKLLDDAYLCVRYENKFRISADHIKMLFLKITEMETRVWKTHKMLMEAPKTSIPETECSLPSPANNEVLNKQDEILEEIVQAIDPERVYCFSRCISQVKIEQFSLLECPAHQVQHFHRYCFVVVSDDQRLVTKLQNNFDGKLPNQETITLLSAAPKEFQNPKHQNSAFYHQISMHAELLYTKNPANQKDQSIFIEPADVAQRILEVYNNRNERSKLFLKLAAKSLAEAQPELALSTLAQALEQYCIGLLAVFLKYSPKVYTLNHLFRLCSICIPAVGEIFKINEEDRLTKILYHAHHKIRYKNTVHIDSIDAILLMHRCEMFFKIADKLCLQKLQAILEAA